MATAPQYSKYAAAAEDVATDLNRYSDTQNTALRTTLGGVAVTNELSPRTLMFAAATMLKHAEPILILEKFAQPQPMPANKSQAIKFRRPVPLKPATTALVEGVTPDPQKMSYADVTTNLAQYGSWMGLTDVVADTHEDPVLKDMSMLSGEQAAETKEMLMWGVVTGGTNVMYTGAVTSRVTTVDPLNLLIMRKVKRAMMTQRGKMITKILNPSANISTKFVEAGFVAIGHTDLEADLRQIPGWLPTAGYGSRQPISEYEVGTIENMRFILSPYYAPLGGAGAGLTQTNGPSGGATDKGKNMSAVGAAADIYQVVVLAQDCFGTVPLKGKDAIKAYVQNPGEARGGDPLGQRGTVGWKTWFAALILNQAWLVRLECTATAL
jgi:N4-gp56 family major capsid protein